MPLAIVALLISAPAPEAESPPEPSPYVEQNFLIVGSTKSFPEAMRIAGVAATKVQIPLNLRGVGYDGSAPGTGGLTFTKTVCEENGWDYPCYVSRGRWDNGIYVSIEYSSAFEGFTEGLYVVVVASGAAKEVRVTLAKVRTVFADAYVKKSKVYVGCMH